MFSVIGGLFGVAVLFLFARPFAGIATWFTVAEYFWLYVLGLGCAVVVSRGSALKGALALLIGLLCSTVGLSPVHTAARFTFGRPELYQGISFIPALVGLFGLSEVLRNVRTLGDPTAAVPLIRQVGMSSELRGLAGLTRSVHAVFGGALALFLKRPWATLQASAIGTVIGILPGAGADIAAWVSYGVSKRTSLTPDEYGRGSIEGVADAGAANNSALAGAWVPALTLGIPGDSITAIVLGIMMMKNLQPGPEIFEKQAVLVHSLYLVFVLANLALLPAGFLAIRASGALMRVPRHTLLPVIVLFCVLGSYAIGGSYFDVGVMLVMGVLGFLLERWQVPVGPVVLGIILGGPLEERFIQAMTASDGSLTVFFARPSAAVLAVVALGVWLLPMMTAWSRRKSGRG
jgi:TctA family transporter